jgi:hypothetical protein
MNGWMDDEKPQVTRHAGDGQSIQGHCRQGEIYEDILDTYYYLRKLYTPSLTSSMVPFGTGSRALGPPSLTIPLSSFRDP